MKTGKSCMLIWISFLVILWVPVHGGTAGEITVDDDGGGDFFTIKEAVDSAGLGDTVLVYPGTYDENVEINKELAVLSISENPSDTVVRANISTMDVFLVTANNVTISGFTMQDADRSEWGEYRAGICLNAVEGCVISNNVLLNSSCGLFLRGSGNVTVLGNAAGHNVYGIYLLESGGNRLEDNNASENGYGIYLSDSGENLLTENNASDNEYGIAVSSSPGNRLENNSAFGNSYAGFSLWGSDGSELSNNLASRNEPYGFFLSQCDGSMLSGNEADLNSYGFYLWGADGNKVFGNMAVRSEYDGIRLSLCDDNLLENNGALQARGSGIYLWGSDRNVLSGNYGHQNVYSGISLEGSDSNLLENNSAINNSNGFSLWASDENELYENRAARNSYGVLLGGSDRNLLEDNRASENVAYGIFVSGSDFNKLYNNTANLNVNTGLYFTRANHNDVGGNKAFDNSNYGVLVTKSESNLFYKNYFNNSHNAYDDSSNSWNASEGNYWSDYTDPDADGDGIGDAPYVINEATGSIDYRPLMEYVIEPLLPVADFAANRTSGYPPLPVQFADFSIGAVSWQWDVDGDGLIDYEIPDPLHSYTVPGLYDVTLNVSNSAGFDYITKPAYINVLGTASPDWNPWNDPESDGGEEITLPELQEAINSWLNDLPAPKTGAELTLERLQELINLWLGKS